MNTTTGIELLLNILNPAKTGVLGFKRWSASEWDDIIQESIRHNVAPLLYKRLKSLDFNTYIQSDMMRRLTKEYLHSSWRNTRLRRELSIVLTSLQNECVPVIALKGTHLAELIYGDMALRPMYDMDFLVRERDLPNIDKVMLAMGYSPPDNKDWWAEYHKHFCYTSSDGNIPVEFHWNIQNPTSPFGIEIEDLWNRTQPEIIADVRTFVLSPMDLLLHLCLHASFQHNYTSGLKPFCDIAETLRYYGNEMDWEQVLHQVCQWGSGNCVHLTLYLAKDMLGAAVPDYLLDALKPNDFNPTLILLAKELIFERNTSSINLNLAQVLTANRFQDKMAILMKNIFPSRHTMAQMYSLSPSSKCIYLYYLKRLTDLFIRHGRTVWELLSHDEDTVTSFKQAKETCGLVYSFFGHRFRIDDR